MEEIIELVYSEIVRSGYANNLAAGIVITGGGSQLQNLVQLAEYLTGMDARIGYPNEHLGKSKIDAVKSPMYATAVGLVLAGYQSLDDRMNRYLEQKQEEGGRREDNRNNAKPSGNGQSGGGDFFKKIIDRTKGLLIDDFDDKQQNY